ncbi:MAG: class I SAM-dependent methyltransferase [Flavisolibacter sp.]|nr:class I SAM-dependent methyltransferase [Flavisolibacter sp.]MBD0352655.1 class I SAM-dependent methyltransferase [Flavisolibacter sp.]MBD0374360.1 class I SAM-dependent methyltransferase [Flavisolibacter sp.]
MLLKKIKSQIRSVARRIIKPILDTEISHAVSLLEVDKIINDNPNLSAKLFSLAGDGPDFIVDIIPDSKKISSGNIPVPPEELWEGYAQTDEDYLEYGEKDMKKMLDILEKAGESAQTLTRVLDLGCAAGRMLRHYPHYEGKSELWGCDINAHHINWCQQHLSPPFLFATTTTAPHLPFEDNYFDLVYCGSVFTHISDLADAWFLEIRRILRRGGYAFLSIHDKHTFELMFTTYIKQERFYNIANNIVQFDKRTGVSSRNYAYFSIGADPISQVYYDVDYLTKKWSRFAKVVSVNPETYNYQTALLLQKV